MTIISKKKINKGRQIEIDLLRGFSALLMIICHVGLYLGNPSNIGLYVFSDIIGSEPVAPIFMSLMGIGIIYSSHNKPIDLLKRGIYLFIIGYILSFFRSLFPYFILGNINEWASIEAFFVVDILQFAGLSFILISLFKKLKLPSYVILLISIIMVIINQYIMLPKSIPWDSKILTGLVDLFTPVSSWSCFPLLTWFFFPSLGMVLGDILIRTINKDILYLILFIIGLSGVLYVYLNFYYLYPNYTSYYYGNNYYYMGIVNVLLTSCFIFFGLSIFYYLRKILPKFMSKYLCFLSKNLNIFYIISWLLISILIHMQSIFNINIDVLFTILLMGIVIGICSVLTVLFTKMPFNKNKFTFFIKNSC